jgi:hypothetical protein
MLLARMGVLQPCLSTLRQAKVIQAIIVAIPLAEVGV